MVLIEKFGVEIENLPYSFGFAKGDLWAERLGEWCKVRRPTIVGGRVEPITALGSRAAGE